MPIRHDPTVSTIAVLPLSFGSDSTSRNTPAINPSTFCTAQRYMATVPSQHVPDRIRIAIMHKRIIEMVRSHLRNESLVHRLRKLRRPIIFGEKHIDLVAAMLVGGAARLIVTLVEQHKLILRAEQRRRPPSIVHNIEYARYVSVLMQPDDIHSDGLQLYLRDTAGAVGGVLVVPEAGGAMRAARWPERRRSRSNGGWTPTEAGYRVTLRVRPAAWEPVTGQLLDFDLIVNEMQPNRERRAGQLVWSGGGGWFSLRATATIPRGWASCTCSEPAMSPR